MGYTHFNALSTKSNGYAVGAKGSEVEVISQSGELKNQVAKTDGQIFLGVNDVIASGGTWTITRNAAGNYSLDKTAAADTTYIAADITNLMRTTSDKGLKLTSFDVVYSIGTAALTTHSVAVKAVTYANNTAVSVADFGGTLSGSLATATQTNPYVSTITLGTPAFATTSDQKIIIEIAITAQATSVYKFYGLFLKFDHNYM